MLRSISQWLGNTVAAYSLRREIDKTPWLRGILLKIGTDLNRMQGCEQSEVLDKIAADPGAKEALIHRLTTNIMAIVHSDEATLECRRWIVRLAHEYAPYKCLFLSEADVGSEESPHWHPCIVGIYDDAELMIELMSQSFAEVVRVSGSYGVALNTLRLKSLELHYELSIANAVRVALGDVGPDGGDWFVRFANTTAALFDITFRHKLKLDCPCDEQRVANEQALMEMNLLRGTQNPLEGVIFAKRYPDWKGGGNRDQGVS